MSRVIAIANQKGGCAKTTTTVNLAAGFARFLPKKRTLIIDVDPQANASAVFMGVQFAAGPRQPDSHTVYEVLMGKAPVDQALYTVDLAPLGNSATAPTLDILPAHLDLASAELELVNLFERERRLYKALAPILPEYDVVIIDCPPSLSLLTINALMTATEVIIPVDPGLFPIIGLNLLQRTIGMVKQANPPIHISGVIPTMIDRTALAQDTIAQLEANFGKAVLPAIPRSTAIGEAHAAGQDIFAYDGKKKGAQAYLQLWKEVVKRG